MSFACSDFSSLLFATALMPQRTLCLNITWGLSADLSLICFNWSSEVNAIQSIFHSFNNLYKTKRLPNWQPRNMFYYDSITWYDRSLHNPVKACIRPFEQRMS